MRKDVQGGDQEVEKQSDAKVERSLSMFRDHCYKALLALSDRCTIKFRIKISIGLETHNDFEP